MLMPDLADVVPRQQVQEVMENRPVRDRHHRLREKSVSGRSLVPRPAAMTIAFTPALLARSARRPAQRSLRRARRWTPASVTIALTSAAGVTSKAGFRAGKRSVTSRGERSSTGIAAPDGVPRSTVDVGATTTNGMSMVVGEHGETIGADLVRDVAVRGDPVGADDHVASPRPAAMQRRRRRRRR